MCASVKATSRAPTAASASASPLLLLLLLLPAAAWVNRRVDLTVLDWRSEGREQQPNANTRALINQHLLLVALGQVVRGHDEPPLVPRRVVAAVLLQQR